jgi:hypothetical protein
MEVKGKGEESKVGEDIGGEVVIQQVVEGVCKVINIIRLILTL